MAVCERIAELWRNKREDICNAADRGFSAIDKIESVIVDGGNDKSVDWSETAKRLVQFYSDTFDDEHGGFLQTRNGPKFPMPTTLLFLTRYHKKYLAEEEALQMATKTASIMVMSALHDHVEGGFHRYCVDRQWSTPHFEKMLYDQALLLEAFTEMYTICGNADLLKGMQSIIDYVKLRLLASNGQFYCAEDADSLNSDMVEEEGTFATWTAQELRALFNANDYKLICDTFGISNDGNAINLDGKNCLNKLKGSRVSDYDENRLENCLKTLYEIRQRRPRPHRDEKILTAWNGLMISGLAKASLYIPDALGMAERALLNVINTAGNIERTKEQPACADDYAFLIKAALDVHNATLKPEYLEYASRLQDEMNGLFSGNAFYYYSQIDPSGVIMRQVDDYDGVEPSANSIALHNLHCLSLLTCRENDDKFRDKMIEYFTANLRESPMSLPVMLSTVALFEPVLVHVPSEFKQHYALAGRHKQLDLIFTRSSNQWWQICHRQTCQIFEDIEQVDNYLKNITTA